MRKIFLDIGAYNGVSVEFFLKNYPASQGFEIFSFECDKRNIKTIKDKNLPIELIEAAAWSSNGMQKYYHGKDDGGTLYESKKTGGISRLKFYWVETIDLAEFIKDNFNKTDYIIVKMNCEGAEYELIPHLKAKGLIGWVDLWFVQWHNEKINIHKTIHDTVRNMINSFQWECQGKDAKFTKAFKKFINNE